MHGVPAEDTEDEVHDEEGAQHHHRHEVDELPRVPLRVMDLKKNNRCFRSSWPTMGSV